MNQYSLAPVVSNPAVPYAPTQPQPQGPAPIATPGANGHNIQDALGGAVHGAVGDALGGLIPDSLKDASTWKAIALIGVAVLIGILGVVLWAGRPTADAVATQTGRVIRG